jgi:hypothetical protein
MNNNKILLPLVALALSLAFSGTFQVAKADSQSPETKQLIKDKQSALHDAVNERSRVLKLYNDAVEVKNANYPIYVKAQADEAAALDKLKANIDFTKAKDEHDYNLMSDSDFADFKKKDPIKGYLADLKKAKDTEKEVLDKYSTADANKATYGPQIDAQSKLINDLTSEIATVSGKTATEVTKALKDKDKDLQEKTTTVGELKQKLKDALAVANFYKKARLQCEKGVNTKENNDFVNTLKKLNEENPVGPKPASKSSDTKKSSSTQPASDFN